MKAAQAKVPRPPLETLVRQDERSPRGRAARRRWAAYSRRLAAIGERGLERLGALEPPRRLRARRDRFFREIATLGTLARQNAPARPAAQRIWRINALVDRIDAEARGLGLRACASE
jgi:hypothetical protein